MPQKSLVLLSAGLDSTAALLLAQETTQVVGALTFDYGQKSAANEIRAARLIASAHKIPHQILNLDFLKIANHPFFDAHIQSPTLPLKDLDTPEITQKTAKAVWVPNRNGVFLNIAASLAEARGWDCVVTGFNKEEAKTFHDNSESYIDSLNQCFKFSTRNGVQVISPTVAFDKSQIVQILLKRDFDFSKLWSCYHNEDSMCGLCESCQRLKRALLQNQQTHWIDRLFMK